MWQYSLLDLENDWFLIQRKRGSKKQFYNDGTWRASGTIYSPKLKALETLRKIIELDLQVIEGLINGDSDSETVSRVQR